MIYILSKTDLKIKDIIQTSEYEINTNISLTGKSAFKIYRQPIAEGQDLIVIGDYKGIITSIETEKDINSFTINVNQLDDLFDRKLILAKENLISTIGIEDFIKETILDNFKTSLDTLLNIPYINITVLTHTLVNASVPTTEGIYNFRTYLGNARELYNIVLDYKFTSTTLDITISKNELSVLEVDATVSDIITYDEVYNVNVTAKVTVLSKATGNTFNYYLLTDRTTTTDINHPNRAKGGIDIVVCEVDSEAIQAGLDAFRSNNYQHNIELTLTKESKFFNEQDFVIGRDLKIKTKDNGIYETFIRKINKKSDSNIYNVKCGNMRITLIEKLKGVLR